MRVALAISGDTVTVSSNEKTSPDVLAMVGSSGLVRARMRGLSRAVFEVQVRKFECMCAGAKLVCHCKKDTEIVEVGDRVA